MRKIIVGNWKMAPSSLQEAKRIFEEIRKGIKSSARKKTEVVICPPFVYLSELGSLGSPKTGIVLGGQDCFWKDKGAFTGEVSPGMLKNLGVKYVLLGHSERRENLAETNEMINKKILAALKQNLKVILCVGEKERDGEGLPTIVKEELLEGLKDISKNSAKNLVIAYEPLWAIGTGQPDKPEDIFEMAIYIRRILADVFGKNLALKIPILYGGSVNSRNARKFLEIEGMAGLLVGGASLDPKEFSGIVNLCPL